MRKVPLFVRHAAMSLVVDWCSYEAAKYAVEHWHYSRKMPAGKLARLGVWENERFIGVVIFGWGATPNICKPFDLENTQVCELVRVALSRVHTVPTSKVIAASLRMLRAAFPGLRLVVSYADSEQGHLGTIYQATNWVCVGSSLSAWLRVGGVVVHPKTLHSRYGLGGQSVAWLREHVDPNAMRIQKPPKHKYVMPLDKAMRRQVEVLRRPYPKRPPVVGSAAPLQTGGSNPTRPLQSSDGGG